MKYNKIVIEGPNNVGKSTIIKALQKEFGYQSEHTTGACPNDYKFYSICLDYPEPLIFDRLHVGEMVYPRLFNREPNLTSEEFRHLLQKHNDDVLIVIMDADYDFIVRSCAAKQEKFDLDFVTQERILFYNVWCNMMNEGFNVLRLKNHWDESGTAKHEIVGKIVEVCNRGTIE